MRKTVEVESEKTKKRKPVSCIVIKDFDTMAASVNKDGQRGKKRFGESYNFNALVREYRKSREAKEGQEQRDKERGKVTKGGEEEVDCVEVFEMEGCEEEEEEARGHEVEVCGREIVCRGANDKDKA